MPGGWAASDRRERLPANWEALRRQVRIRSGGRCEVIKGSNSQRCTNPARDCDHILAGDDHRLQNLQDICVFHHRHKSSVEGNAAKAARVAAGKRPPERHPGLR